MLKTKYWVGQFCLEIEELNPNTNINKEHGDLILSDENHYNRLTKVNVDDVFSIYVYWDSRGSISKTLDTLVLPHEYVMFIGAGCISAQINLNDSSLICKKRVCEFEYFMRFKNCIIEACYGECSAYSLSGELLNHHELSMMWNIEFKDDYLCTVCDDYGERKLVKVEKYP